jgi:16S rRNA C1402 (ribose-2'-O) methylase RsmI
VGQLVEPSVAPVADAVEIALADALTKAANAGQWETVSQLARELEARRRAREAVVDLDAERAKRKSDR